jgi:3-oxoacyl-[acyl-carrier protein] reductase
LSGAGKPPRVALVTGAAQGLGRAIATRLAADGHQVVVADRQQDKASEAAAAIRSHGGVAEALALDVGDQASVTAGYASVDARFGRLDILVNNAGIGGVRGPVTAMTLADFESVIRVNLTGTFLMSHEAIPRLRARGWGRIVNMASLVARGQPGINRANYTASKAGIVGLSRVLADQLGRDGITVNCVAPSRMMTALTRAAGAGNPDYFASGAAQSAVGRLGEPEEVAHAVAWLCSDAANFVTGAVLDVNGGTTMI